MADVSYRDLAGPSFPGPRTEPAVAPPPRAYGEPRSGAANAPPAGPALFGPDPQQGDAIGLEPVYLRLAELALLRRTGTPTTIGILGEPGSGKSFALERVIAQTQTLARMTAATTNSPFVSAVHVARIEAGALVGDPTTAIAARLHASLREPYPDLSREIGYVARDPHVSLRETNDKLDDARRRLDVERRTLDDAGSRRARLVETVLFETSGSAVDSYARANRAGLERRYAGFGIAGDPVRSFKDFVLFVAGTGGKQSLGLRSLYEFKGQTKLIVVAILLVALGIGIGITLDLKASWLAAMRGGAETGNGLADWMQAHLGLLSTAHKLAYLGAFACIATNVWRAFSFMKPIMRGAALLDGDLDGRRHDLDGLYAHQTKRVDALEGDIERLTREASDAESRVDGRSEPSPFEPSDRGAAEALFAALSATTARDPGQAPVGPQRIVLAIDDIDGLAFEPARQVLDALRRHAGPGFVVLVALDPTRFEQDAPAALERAIDIPMRLSALDDPAALVGRWLGRVPALGFPAKANPTRCELEAPLDGAESDLLADVAPLAGQTPRALRRFVSLYRLARLEDDTPRGALAFALALRLGGKASEREAVTQAMRAASEGFKLSPGVGRRLTDALEAANAYDREDLSETTMVMAARLAARFSFGKRPAPAR